jgi:hypothetical protein
VPGIGAEPTSDPLAETAAQTPAASLQAIAETPGEWPRLIAYRLGRRGEFADPEPAERRRAWSDATPQRFANRCLPLLVANQCGWVVRAPGAIEATWSGGRAIDQVQINGWTEPWPCPASSHFGNGILTWTIPFLFRTPPGFNLLARGPANNPKDGISALEGVIETDWAIAPFTMNWKLTRPGLPVRFDKGEPICMVVPQHRGELEAFVPEVCDVGDDPEVSRSYRRWRKSRATFNSRLREGQEQEKWQKHYFRGTSPSGAIAPEHQTVLRLRPFAASAAPAESSTNGNAAPPEEAGRQRTGVNT